MDPETTAGILEAYFCKGDPYWPLKLSEGKEHSIIKASIIMAHFLVCNQTKEFPAHKEYRDKMLTAIGDSTPSFLSIMDEKTEACLGHKIECLIFEHVCGERNIWNSENLLKFIVISMENSEPYSKQNILWHAASFLLKGNNLKIFTSSMSNLCPMRAKHCGANIREKRLATTEFTEIQLQGYFRAGKMYSRAKRFFDQFEMMRLFNKMVCNREIMETLAEYWDVHYIDLGYSRLWIMGVLSDVWCCMVQKLYEGGK